MKSKLYKKMKYSWIGLMLSILFLISAFYLEIYLDRIRTYGTVYLLKTLFCIIHLQLSFGLLISLGLLVYAIRKKGLIMIIANVVILLLYVYLFPMVSINCRRKILPFLARVSRIEKVTNTALLTISNMDVQILPQAEKWDESFVDYGNITNRYTESSESYDILFNKNIESIEIKQLPSNTVMFFESSNSNHKYGEKERFRGLKKNGSGFVSTLDGNIVVYNQKDDSYQNVKTGKKESVLWKAEAEQY